MRKSAGIAALAAAGLMAAGMAAPASAAKPSDSISDIVAESEDHDTLEFALATSGLDEVLDGKRQFTLFAPTDDAFDALPAGTLGKLLSEDQKGMGYPDLTNILLYHVAPGERFASDVLSSKKVRTISKQFALVDARAGTIANAPISGAGTPGSDLDATNGVVHVIDAVMLP